MENQIKQLKTELLELVQDFQQVTFWQFEDSFNLSIVTEDTKSFAIWLYFDSMTYSLSSANEFTPNEVIQLIESKGFKTYEL